MKTRKLIDPQKTVCIVCNHILSLQRPVLFVAHDDDNAWKFTCRHIGHKMTKLKVMPLNKVIEFDASLKDLLEMPPGVGAQRSNASSPWEPFLLNPEEHEE